MRDDFLAKTVRDLAGRVGYKCSNPSCGKVTVGPESQATGAINVGVAAHITAAAPGGPRFDECLSSEQRRSAENGIWVCQTCAKLINSDIARFSKAILQNWKQRAEIAAMREHQALDQGQTVAILARILDGHSNYVDVLP
jgi:hypothetical protein